LKTLNFNDIIFAIRRTMIAVIISAPIGAAAMGANWTVRNGESIQAAVTRAAPGDRIDIEPGTYSETVYIDKDRIDLHGIVRDGHWPVVDGKGQIDNGVITSGHGVTIEYLWVRGFKGNGIMTQGSNNFRILHNVVEGPCFYAIFPQYGKNGLVAYNIAFKSDDAAIYVGMSDNVDITHNETYGGFSGIEAENSRNVLIEDNYVHDNVGGIMTTMLGGLPVKTADNLIIRNNFVVNNNMVNTTPPNSAGANLPTGVGVIVLGTDHTTVEGNFISNNKTVGIMVADSFFFDPTPDDKMDPFPDNDRILRNVFFGNGSDPQGNIKDMLEAVGLKKGVDIMSTGKGHDNCIADRNAASSLGTSKFIECSQGATSASITSLMTASPVVAPAYTAEQKGRLTYLAVCSGCHTWDTRLTGPPMITIKALYGKDARRLADWIANPSHKRKDYPEMPSQKYLPDDVRLAVARYIVDELSH
jgi:parallel beta-helix repeat protein